MMDSTVSMNSDQSSRERSLRPWLTQVVTPRVIRWLIVLAIVLLIGALFWILVPVVFELGGPCRSHVYCNIPL